MGKDIEIAKMNELDFNGELSHLNNEIIETERQIEQALQTANQHQSEQLHDYKAKIEEIKSFMYK
ncbi:hypothetical protein [Aquibacillus sediminis]|uniref:hypothetical protein n=1 Tax=Aquibacillus sediminis TaxID=2574734 RepID=UPI001108C272|nr:hypothetical protein [Aquibacillus sediminis]